MPIETDLLCARKKEKLHEPWIDALDHALLYLSNGTAIAGSTTFVSGKSQRTESDVLALRSSAVNHPI
jgi:hypothetical protein